MPIPYITGQTALCARHPVYHHIELNNRMVPNVQPTDINDVVDFDRIIAWVWEWERTNQLKQGEAMRRWLKIEDPWVEI